MAKRKKAKALPWFRATTSSITTKKESRDNAVKRLIKRRKMKRELGCLRDFNKNKILPNTKRASTIVISDSDDDCFVKEDVTVIPIVDNPSAPLTPPPDTSTSSTTSAGNAGPSTDVKDEELPSKEDAPQPLFFDSRRPNNGRDVKPTYQEGPAQGALSLTGLLNVSEYSQNDSIMERPASTPLEAAEHNPFEYSAISDTSLQFTKISDESTLVNKGDVGADDETLVAGSAIQGTKRKADEPVVIEEGREEAKATEAQLESLEEGEIIELTEEESEDGVSVGENDDSVVFISEEFLSPKRMKAMKTKPNMMQIIKDNAQKIQKKLRVSRSKPSSSTPKVQPEATPIPKGKKRRMIIIDGSNVAFSHREDGKFSVDGLELCLQYFLSRGFDAKAVIPQFRMKRTQTDNHVKMLQLEAKKLLIKTPAKDLAGKFAASYDDRFILNIAKEFDAAVVSNDHYRDLMPESPDFAFVISNRVIGYTWVMDKLFIPDDPYGKIGPSLNQILYVDEN